MPYIGRGLTTGAQYQKLDAIAINNATTFTMSVGSANVSPDQNHLILVVNGVIQEPGTGFTVSGSTCTLASAITTSGHSGTDTIYGVIAGDAAFAAYDSIGVNALGVTAGTVTASRAVVPDSNKDIASFRNVTLTGELDAATLDISGNADIDGTTNLDAVDIDGAVQIDSTVTVGVDDTGYDVKFFGATSGAYMLWDESADDLVLAGDAGIDLEGDIDVNGTANLDVVDIDGAFTQDGGVVVFNEDSGDYDFRVESNGNANMFFVDAGNNRVGMGTNSVSSDSVLGVSGSMELIGASNRYYIPRQSDGALTGSIYSRTGNNVTISGAGSSSGQIEFIPSSANSSAVAMTIDSSQNVGVGTTSPSYKLHIAEDKANEYAAYIINDNADGSGLRLRCDDSDGDEYLFYAENSTTARFAIKSDGKTGIGTASPGGVLQIDAGLGAPSDLGNFEEYHLILRDSGGNTNDAVGMLFTSSADTYGGSAIVHYDTGSGGTGDLAFYTKQSTSAVAPAEVMRLTDDGKVGIGTNAPAGLLEVENSSGNANVYITSADASNSRLYLGHQSDSGDGFIDYDHGTAMYFGTDGTTRLTILEDGRVAIKATALPNDFGGERGHLCISSTDNAGANNYSILQMQGHSINSSGVNGIIAFYDHSTELARIQSNSLGSSQADLRFSTHDGSSSAERMRITSGGNVLIAKTSTGFSNVGFEVDSGGRVGVKTNGSEAMYINRSQDGTLIEFASADTAEGTIAVSGSTVAYNGFSGNHESSGIPNDTAIGTVVSTIDELDVYPDTDYKTGESHSKAGQTRTDHAKIKVSDSVGDKRVYGVLSSFNDDNKPMVASVGIGSIKVTGVCQGGDLLESNGDGTAKVQDDDIIRSKTIGKVTIGDSKKSVKLVSCVLYCG